MNIKHLNNQKNIEIINNFNVIDTIELDDVNIDIAPETICELV